jgi:hypothetical protein
MENNQNYVATMFDAIFPILNVSQVYVSGVYMPKEHTAKVFYEAFKECQNRLEKGDNSPIKAEYYMEQLKKWAKQTEEIIFMSLLTYHPEKFYPQQIDALPEASEFWGGMYQKEQWEQYDESQHPFFDSWVQEMQDITKEMWQEF